MSKIDWLPRVAEVTCARVGFENVAEAVNQIALEALFAGEGEICKLMRSLDWSHTPFGPVSGWSASLRIAVRLMLASRFPIQILWGENYHLLYNDAYCPILGSKHPQSLTQRGEDCWRDVWGFAGPLLAQVRETGQACGWADQLLLIDRNGYLEECYFTFSYTPICDEVGVVEGIFNEVHETTQRVLAERRQRWQNDLARQIVVAKTSATVCQLAADVLTNAATDIPFALFYLLDSSGMTAELVSSVGLSSSPSSMATSIPPVIELTDSTQVLGNRFIQGLVQVHKTGRAVVLDDIATYWEDLPLGPWGVAPSAAVIIPIATPGQTCGVGFMVSGISPRRSFDEDYHSFLDAIAGHMALIIAGLLASQACSQVPQILESMSDAFVALDRNWRITYANWEAARLNNTSPAAMVGKIHWEMWQWSVGTIVEQNYQQAIAEQHPVHFEVLYEPLQMWLEIRAYPSESGLGVYFRDVTERKQTEAALRVSEARFRAAQELSLDAFTVLRSVRDAADTIVDFVWTYVNPTAARILQRRVEDLVGQRLLEVLPGNKTNSELFDRYVRVVETGEPHDIEVSYEAEGIVGWFRNMTVKLEDGIAISFSDITERKRMEEALRQSEAHHRYLAESIPHLVWITNSQGENKYVNQQMCAFTGLSSEQLLGAGWEAIIHPDDLDKTFQKWQIAVQAASFYETEYRLKGADGNYCWFLARGIPLKDDSDRIVEWFGTCTDIQRQKDLEAERIHWLEQEQIARQQAETANRIKDEFLAVLSHELRSPLNPILGWAELLQAGRLDAEKTSYAIATINRNAKLQAKLIEDLLDVSRILRGKLSLNVTPVDLQFVITAAIETVRLAAETKRIQLHFTRNQVAASGMADNEGATYPTDHFQVMGDAARLQQIVWNLLSNAIKFTPVDGQVTIDLSVMSPCGAVDSANTLLTATDQSQVIPASWLQITVTDTGKGISPEFLPYVFDYFRQADATTTRSFGGLGLGLAIVRHLVELHGGTVHAASPGEGQGATFTVKLTPLQQIGTGTMHDDSAIYPSAATPLADLPVLVVDDDLDARELVTFILEHAGARVVTASSGMDALQMMAQFPIAVLVSDVGMPGMDGYTLMRHVQSLYTDPTALWATLNPTLIQNILTVNQTMPKAIAVTAYASDNDQSQAVAAGFHQHLAKPIIPEELIAAIVHLVTTG